jgi:O-antigen/teichoic acid export membrane protein
VPSGHRRGTVGGRRKTAFDNRLPAIPAAIVNFFQPNVNASFLKRRTRRRAGGAEVAVASIDSEHAPRSPGRMPAAMSRAFVGVRRAALAGAVARLRALFADGSDSSLMRRLAGAAFLIRLASAAIAFVSQILLARWMGGFEFGIYVYAWTWVLLIGGMVDLGLGSATQRFIPEYSERRQFALLRGFLRGSRFLATTIAAMIAVVGAAVVRLLTPHLGPETVVPLYLACAALPLSGLAQVQSGIARSYDWVYLGLMPVYVQRQLLLLALMGLAYAAGLPTDAATATLAGVVSLWAVTIGQFVVLDRRLAATVASGPKAYAVRAWLLTAAPIFLVEAFYLLLTYADVIVLQQFRPPDEVAVYYAATKTLALVAFIYFSVAQTIAHKFAEYHVSGDGKRLAAFLRQSVRLTFWPSLACILLLLAFGRPLLRLFGAGFASGYYLMFIIAVGLLARAAVGPAERLLNMLGERSSCALVYGASFALNLILCIVLIPRTGLAGAASANAAALVFESAALFLVAKYRLGLHCLIFGRPRAAEA